MSRLVLCLGGALTALAAYVMYETYKRTPHPIPASKAADMLRQAWADSHTRA